jgi:hypothetical protein
VAAWLRAASDLSIVALVMALSLAGLVVLIGAAAMTAIWHPDLERRKAAYRVLDRLLRALTRERPMTRTRGQRGDRGG